MCEISGWRAGRPCASLARPAVGRCHHAASGALKPEPPPSSEIRRCPISSRSPPCARSSRSPNRGFRRTQRASPTCAPPRTERASGEAARRSLRAGKRRFSHRQAARAVGPVAGVRNGRRRTAADARNVERVRRRRAVRGRPQRPVVVAGRSHDSHHARAGRARRRHRPLVAGGSGRRDRRRARSRHGAAVHLRAGVRAERRPVRLFGAARTRSDQRRRSTAICKRFGGRATRLSRRRPTACAKRSCGFRPAAVRSASYHLVRCGALRRVTSSEASNVCAWFGNTRGRSVDTVPGTN